jgi:hypothetical protein
MAEFTRSQYEALEVAAAEAQEAFVLAVEGNPVLARAFWRWRAAESRLVEARRGWREAEVHRLLD